MIDIPELVADLNKKPETVNNAVRTYYLIHRSAAVIRDDLVKYLKMPRSTVYEFIKVLFYKNLVNKLSFPKTAKGRPIIYFSTVEDVLFKSYESNPSSSDSCLNTILSACSEDALSLKQIKELTKMPEGKIITYLPNTCFIKSCKPSFDSNPLQIIVPENIMNKMLV